MIALGTDAVKFGGGLHDAAHAWVFEGVRCSCAVQQMEKADSDAGNLVGAARVGVGGTSGGVKTSCCGRFEAFAVGEIVAPLVPEAGFAEGKLAIGFEALQALLRDFFLPNLRGLFGLGRLRFFQQFCEDI